MMSSKRTTSVDRAIARFARIAPPGPSTVIDVAVIHGAARTTSLIGTSPDRIVTVWPMCCPPTEMSRIGPVVTYEHPALTCWATRCASSCASGPSGITTKLRGKPPRLNVRWCESECRSRRCAGPHRERDPIADHAIERLAIRILIAVEHLDRVEVERPKSRIFATPRLVTKFGGLNVPMGDPFRVRGVQGVGDLNCPVNHFVRLERFCTDPMPQGFPFEILHGDEGLAIILANVENGADVRMPSREEAVRASRSKRCRA